jgi:hypothetical protein
MAESTDNGIKHGKPNESVNVTQAEDATLPPMIRVDSYKDDRHINLTWRSWMVVFVTCFA